LQDSKTRASEFERLFVTELMKTFAGQTSKAAEVLERPQKELTTIMNELQIEFESLLTS
jgi:DNA-binding NtrC family response regulator